LAVLVKSDEHRPRQTQLDALTANLQFAADVVRNFGLTIGLEPMIALPGMLFRNCAEAGELLGRLADPALKLIFDTGHAYDMGDDIVPSFDAFFDHVGLVQFADQPGRLEPGSGRIDFESLLTIAHRRGYRGLIELEHAWSKPGVQGEAEGIERLRALDQKACETAARGAG
jgi:hydroxypyruvate isomerase